MNLIINNKKTIGLTICEKDLKKSVHQNIALLLSTKKGTIPYYREFGLPMEFIGKPFKIAEAIISQEISEAIESFETRAVLKEVKLEEATDYNSYFVTVEVEIKDGLD